MDATAGCLLLRRLCLLFLEAWRSLHERPLRVETSEETLEVTLCPRPITSQLPRLADGHAFDGWPSFFSLPFVFVYIYR